MKLYSPCLAAVLFGGSLGAFSPSEAVAQTTAASGQADGTALSGVVRDPSGGAIPRATVVIQQEPSGLERVVSGSGDGRFSIPRLAAGRYVITVSAAGFGPASNVIEIPADSSVTFTLSPAPIVEQVTVVSASRQAELRDTLNTRVEVITRGRLDEGAGHETVGEILRELSGVVSRRGSESAGPAGEQVQGIDSRQVLVLLDGQPIVGARGIKRGGVLNLDRQSTARLERVEVVKGAASALYGSDAIGGVINLITREPSSPFDATVSLSGGNLGAIGTRLDTGFKHERTLGVFSAERHQHDGFDLTPGTIDTTGAPYRRYDALAKVHRRLAPSFSLGGTVTGYHNHTTGVSVGELGSQEDDVTDRAVGINLTGQWVRGGTNIEARGYMSTYAEDVAGRLTPPRSTSLEPATLDERFGKLDLAIARPIGARQLVQAGVEWSRDRYDGTNRVRDEVVGHGADTTVLWGQHRWSATSRLTTTAGVRVDRRSPYETAVSPKAAAHLRVSSDLIARVSYGRGFRAPDLGQLYYRFLSSSNFYQVIGNPALNPEHADSWQIGADYTAPRRRARFGVNLFRNDVRDLIDSVNLGFIATPAQLAAVIAREGLDPSFNPALGRLLLTYRNVTDVVTQGVELDAESALTSTLSVAGAYTYLSARDADTELELTGRNPHHGHVRVSWQPVRTGFRAGLRGTFFSSWIATRTTTGSGVQDAIAPRFALWDAFASQRIGRGLSAFLTIDNLANSKDPNAGVLLPTGAPAPIHRPEAGRTARVGVQWSFAAR
jgi:outer membrane receptor for ferrienterochelin and colicins